MGTEPARGVRIEAAGLGIRVLEKTHEVPILEKVSFVIEPGEVVSVIGPSGSGKSTLLAILAGLLRPTEGSVRLIGAIPDQPVRLGVAFQRPGLLGWRSALSNVVLPLEIGELNAQLTPAEREARGMEALRSVALDHVAAYMPRQLSGGMLSKVSLARAIVNDPDLMLLDEPCGALDEMSSEKLIILLSELVRRQRATALMVTHSLQHAAYFSDRILVLARSPGQIVASIDNRSFRRAGRESFAEPGFIARMMELREELWKQA